MRQILSASGYQMRFGRPGAQDLVGVWGQTPYARRGEAKAERYGAGLVRIEDAFLRSLHPGRLGEPPLGLLIDHSGVHFDGRRASDLETLLATHPLDNHTLLERARMVMARMRAAHLSKYSATLPDAPAPDPGYVLVIDQTQGDASVLASGGDRARFQEMLFVAQEEHPGARFVVKTHPETQAGQRDGHYRDSDAADHIALYDGPASPWSLLDGARAVYTLSSQMGFEAILAGHRPRVFGQPFYAGWGLTEDEDVFTRRQRRLTRAQLVAASMILYPRWYDPYRNTICEIETVLDTLEAQARAWREDHAGWVASGMRLWKRAPLQKVFGGTRRVVFEDDPKQAKSRAQSTGRAQMAWASKATGDVVHVEDGFLRSRGLGAALTPPLSLVLDPIGIYYDPTRPSTLEALIRERAQSLRPDQSERAHRLIQRLIGGNLSKYNLGGERSALPDGHRILVPGQVEDDASILTASCDVQRNADLLARVRAENPDATILWKPHPDVDAGLREGVVPSPQNWADLDVSGCDIAALLSEVDEVWTMTSLTGFEGLLRGCKVVTLGAPFYAGWGLTQDLGTVPARRLQGPRPVLEALVHACLIDYPRYFDPVTGQACPVEVVVDRLETGRLPKAGLLNRSLSKLQGLFASQSHLWRK